MLVKVVAKTVTNLFEKRQKLIGYRVTFPSVPSNWVKNFMEVDMTYTWRRAGLKGVSGVNYFTLGNIKDGISQRFNPKSKYYQAWTGCYLFRVTTPESWTINDFHKLALADQDGWLSTYGINGIKTHVVSDSIKELPHTLIDGYKGITQYGHIVSYSDVGRTHHRGARYYKLRIFEHKMRSVNDHIGENALIPCSLSNRCEEILLSGIVVLVEITKDVRALFYGNGYINPTTNIDTFDTLKNEILQIITSAKIERLK